MEANPRRLEGEAPATLQSLPPSAGEPKKSKAEPPSADKKAEPKELTEDQKAALKAAGLEF